MAGRGSRSRSPDPQHLVDSDCRRGLRGPRPCRSCAHDRVVSARVGRSMKAARASACGTAFGRHGTSASRPHRLEDRGAGSRSPGCRSDGGRCPGRPYMAALWVSAVQPPILPRLVVNLGELFVALAAVSCQDLHRLTMWTTPPGRRRPIGARPARAADIGGHGIVPTIRHLAGVLCRRYDRRQWVHRPPCMARRPAARRASGARCDPSDTEAPPPSGTRLRGGRLLGLSTGGDPVFLGEWLVPYGRIRGGASR
jgi:hypothetical protein